MLNIVLVEPEIPQNCGNIARTCAATGARLHLIRPLGFDISEKAVRRAGLDYWHLVDVRVYDNLEDFFTKNGVCPPRLPGATVRRAIMTAATCSSARRPKDCRRASWKTTGKAASGSPCGIRSEV